ncbi:unnamed protein product [Boreogadus saida]
MVIQVDPDRESSALDWDQDQEVLLVLEDDALPEAEVVSRPRGEDLHSSLMQQEAVVSWQQAAVVSRQQAAVVSRRQAAVVFGEQEDVISIQQEAVVSRQQATVIARQQEAALFIQQDAVVSKKPEAVVSRQNEALVSRQQEAVVSRQQEAVVSRQQEAVVSRQQEAVVSRQQEAVVSRQQEAVVSRQQEAVVSRQQEAVVSRQQEAVVSKQQEAVVSRQQEAVLSRQPSDGQMESDDFCAVCQIGGELLCCDRCPKVFHLSCHIPSLLTFPAGDWLCTLCRGEQDAAEGYACESAPSGESRAPYTLSTRDQRRCEKLTLLLLCHLLSAPFHEAVSPLAQNYYQIIRRPMDLSVVRRKLDESNTLHYFTPEQFVDDLLLMFRNCATFNYPDSEVARAGRDLEAFFLEQLRQVFSDRTFPAACQKASDQARLCWLHRKRKDNSRKKKHLLGGKKYFL